MHDILFNEIVLILDSITALCIMAMLLLHKRIRVFPVSHKIGLWLGAVGLLGQAYRSFLFLITGASPHDDPLSLWLLKDAGYWFVTMGIVFLIIKKRFAK